MDTTIRALTRFGLGARIGESESIVDGRQWLRAQLQRPQAVLAGTELAEIASSDPDSARGSASTGPRTAHADAEADPTNPER